MHKRINVLILFIICSMSLLSQTANKKHSLRYYKKNPVWISMMNDAQANYYETIKAFKTFWKDRILPKEEFENSEMESFEKEIGLVENEKEEKAKKSSLKPNPDASYASEVRAFKGWLQSVKPWVRADGSIINETERQAIINKQQTELKEIEKKNGKK